MAPEETTIEEGTNAIAMKGNGNKDGAVATSVEHGNKQTEVAVDNGSNNTNDNHADADADANAPKNSSTTAASPEPTPAPSTPAPSPSPTFITISTLNPTEQGTVTVAKESDGADTQGDREGV